MGDSHESPTLLFYVSFDWICHGAELEYVAFVREEFLAAGMGVASKIVSTIFLAKMPAVILCDSRCVDDSHGPLSEAAPMHANRLARHFALAATAVVAGTASADVVHWADANLVIPATFAGLYINVETRTTGSSKSLAGWDINPYGSGSLLWYSPTGEGMLQLPEYTGASSLSLGYVVDASGTFLDDTSSEFVEGFDGFWQYNASNYFGFSFTASDGELHYAWGRMVVGATETSRVIAEIAFESDAGVGIAVGAVPAPGAIALLGLACLSRRSRR